MYTHDRDALFIVLCIAVPLVLIAGYFFAMPAHKAAPRKQYKPPEPETLRKALWWVLGTFAFLGFVFISKSPNEDGLKIALGLFVLFGLPALAVVLYNRRKPKEPTLYKGPAARKMEGEITPQEINLGDEIVVRVELRLRFTELQREIIKQYQYSNYVFYEHSGSVVKPTMAEPFPALYAHDYEKPERYFKATLGQMMETGAKYGCDAVLFLPVRSQADASVVMDRLQAASKEFEAHIAQSGQVPKVRKF